MSRSGCTRPTTPPSSAQYRDGRVQTLKVSPASRRKDVVDRSTMRQRIRTLVEVALADRNYLFGLPPMLDAQPVPGRTTAGWIRRYGHTLEGCTSGPWLNSVFKGNVVFLHILDWPKEGVRLAAIPRGLVSSASVTGDVRVRQDAEGWMLTGTPDSLDTIVRLEFDRPVEEIAYALPSKGSLTAGRERTVTTDPEGRMVAEVNLGEEREVGRFRIHHRQPGVPARSGETVPAGRQAG